MLCAIVWMSPAVVNQIVHVDCKWMQHMYIILLLHPHLQVSRIIVKTPKFLNWPDFRLFHDPCCRWRWQTKSITILHHTCKLEVYLENLIPSIINNNLLIRYSWCPPNYVSFNDFVSDFALVFVNKGLFSGIHATQSAPFLVRWGGCIP